MKKGGTIDLQSHLIYHTAWSSSKKKKKKNWPTGVIQYNFLHWFVEWNCSSSAKTVNDDRCQDKKCDRNSLLPFTSGSFIDHINSLCDLQPMIYWPDLYRCVLSPFTYLPNWNTALYRGAPASENVDIWTLYRPIVILRTAIIVHVCHTIILVWSLSQTSKWYNTCLIAFCCIHFIQGLLLWKGAGLSILPQETRQT